MRQDVLDIPDHLRDALWKVETARLAPLTAPAGLLVCGMGGSAIGGDLAAAALGPRLRRPMLTVRGYDLPPWASAEWAVLASSYSGDTEETVACFERAGDLGCPRLAATTGGRIAELAREAGVPVVGLPGILPAPRAAVAYMLVTALAAAAVAGVGESLAGEVEDAAAWLEGRREELQPLAAELAGWIGGAAPVIHGAGLTVAAARRWKAQVNENAGRPAFCSELPESCHNELAAWGWQPRNEADGKGSAGPVTGGEVHPGAEAGDDRNDAEAAGGRGKGAGQVGAGDESRPEGGRGPEGADGHCAVFLVDADQHPRERRRIEILDGMLAEAGVPARTIAAEGETRTARLVWLVMLGDLVSIELAERAGTDPLPIPAIDHLKQQLG